MTHAEIPRLSDATELNNDGMNDQVGRRPLPNRNEFINFSERDLINDDSSFCSILLALACSVMFFPLEKLLLNARPCL